MTCRIVLLAFVVFIAGCTSPALNPNVLHDFTKVISQTDSRALIQASNAAKHPAHLKPFLLRRAAELADLRGAKTLRIVNAEAWFAGGPGEVWLAQASVEFSKESLDERDSVQYSVSRLMNSELFSMALKQGDQPASLKGLRTIVEDGRELWAFATFADTVATEGGLWKLADATIKLLPGNQIIHIRSAYENKGFLAGVNMSDQVLSVALRSGQAYVLKGTVANGAIQVWVENESQPGVKLSKPL